MNKIERLKEEIRKADWICWSNGRSTDYVDEFYEETSIENLIELVDKHLSSNHNKANNTQTLNNNMAGSKDRPLVVTKDKSGNETLNLNNKNKEVKHGRNI